MEVIEKFTLKVSGRNIILYIIRNKKEKKKKKVKTKAVVKKQENVFYNHFYFSFSPFCLVTPCARSRARVANFSTTDGAERFARSDGRV